MIQFLALNGNSNTGVSEPFHNTLHQNVHCRHENTSAKNMNCKQQGKEHDIVLALLVPVDFVCCIECTRLYIPHPMQ